MYLQGQPRDPRRGRGRIAVLAIGAFFLTAVGLTAAIRSVDSSPTEATAQPAATTAAPAATAHVHATPAAAELDAAVAEAPKNTMSADAPAYRPAAVQRVRFEMTEKTVEIAPARS